MKYTERFKHISDKGDIIKIYLLFLKMRILDVKNQFYMNTKWKHECDNTRGKCTTLRNKLIIKKIPLN